MSQTVSIAFGAESASIIPFSIVSTVFAGFIATFGAMGTIANGLILTIMLNERTFSTNSILNYGLCISDFLLCITECLIMAYNLSCGGFAIGERGCLLSEFINMALCFSSFSIIAAISLDRWLKIFMSYSSSLKTVFNLLIFIWSVAASLAAYPYWSQTYPLTVNLQSSMIYCNPNFQSREPAALGFAVFSITLGLICLFGVLGLWIHIVAFYYKAMMHRQRIGISSGNDKILERKLLMRAIALCGTFLLCWTSYVVLVVQTLVTGESASPLLDGLAATLAFANSAANPFILFWFDARIFKKVLILLGMPNWAASSSKERSSSGLILVTRPSSVALQRQNTIRLSVPAAESTMAKTILTPHDMG